MGSPLCAGDVAVYVTNKPTKLAHFFVFCSSVYFCLYGPFTCISFHEFSQQLPAFSFWSYFCLIGPFNYTSLYESPTALI